jgi:uncharacterized membrane-anchored protein YhcB (DUF1043 family)
MIIGFIAGVVVGFVAGVLVYRKNKKHSEQIIANLKVELEKVKK